MEADDPVPSTSATTASRSIATGKPDIGHQPRLLSLDGGGVRGLSSLMILREIMMEIKRQTNATEIPLPCEYFDLIGGTSTGGLIAIMLGRLRMSIDECIDRYLKLSEKIFKRDQVLAGVIPTGDHVCRFDHKIFEEVLRELIENKLKDATAPMSETASAEYTACPMFVVANSAANADAPPVLFRSYERKGQGAAECHIWQAARATSAAPSFFKPMRIEIPRPGRFYVDGGLRYNNPSKLVLDEARHLWPTVKRFCLVSIGTGRQQTIDFVNINDSASSTEEESTRRVRSSARAIPGTKFFRSMGNSARGLKQLKIIAEACVKMSTSSEPVHQELYKLAHSTGFNQGLRYHRFNVEKGMDSIGLEEWKANDRLAQLTDDYMREGEAEKKRDDCVKDLVNPDPVERSEIRYFLVPRVYRRNPHFVGRSHLIKALRIKLCDNKKETFNHRIALYGLGGVGKTEVAIEYVFQFKEEYHSIFWIQAATLADMLSGFQKIAEVTRCVDPVGKTAPSVADEVLAWLERQSSWLLVMDNLDNANDVQDAQRYFPRLNSPTNHLLITTRKPDATGIAAEAVEVPVFSANSAAELLLLRSSLRTENDDPKVEAEAVDIVTELGYLPLAIEQAAAYLRESLKDLFRFRTVYAESRKKLLARRPRGPWNYPHTVATTWLMSFETVAEKNPDAAQILTFFAFLNPDGILIEFLQAGLQSLRGSLKAVFQRQFEFYEALGDLEQYGLIRRSVDDESVSIHRLVQAVHRDNLDPQREIEYMEMAVAHFLQALPLPEEVNRQIWRKYQSQIVGPMRSMLHLHTERVGLMSYHLGAFLLQDGKWKDCEQFALAATEIFSELYGEDDRRACLSMNNLAVSVFRLGRLEEALSLFEKLLNIQKRVLGVKHRDTLLATQSIANIYQSLGRNHEAIDLSKKILAEAGGFLSDSDLVVTGTMANLGAAYHELGLYSEARHANEKVVGLRENALGSEHPETLQAMNNLAMTLQSLGEKEVAKSLYKKVLEIQDRVLGEEHPDTLASMNNLANLLHEVGRIQEAAQLDEKVLEIEQRRLGEEHPSVLRSMNNLAMDLLKLGERGRAAALLKKTNETSKRTLGEKHPITLQSMQNLGVSYYQMGLIKESAKLLENVLCIEREVLGEDHPNTRTTLVNLADSFSELDRLPEAAALLEKHLEFRRKAMGDEHEDVLLAMNNLASVYHKLGRLSDAVSLQEKLPVILESRLGKEHRLTMTAISNRAYTYRALGRITDAVALFEESLNLQRRVLGDKDPQTLITMNNLGTLYWESGQRDDGTALLEQAEEKSKQFLGAEHPVTLNVMSHIALTRMFDNHVDRRLEAAGMLEHVVRVRRGIFGNEHRDTLDAMYGLASVYWKLDRDKEALELLEAELEGRRKIQKVVNDDLLLNHLRNLTKLYRDLERVEDAERLELEMQAREAAKTEESSDRAK